MNNLVRFLTGLLRYGVVGPVLTIIALVLWYGCGVSLIALARWLAFGFGWTAVPADSWQGNLLGFLFCVLGGLMFSVGAFNLIGGEKAEQRFTSLIKTVFTPLAKASDRWTGSLRLRTGKATISRSIHGQSTGPVVFWIGLPLTIGGIASSVDILTKHLDPQHPWALTKLADDGSTILGPLWVSLFFILIAGCGLYIVFYRNRIIINSGSQTIETDSGVPGFRFAVRRRPWSGNAHLRLFRVRPYIQTSRGRVAEVFVNDTILNTGRRLWWCLVEFRDDKEAIRLGQFALDSVAIGFAERVALQLGLRWEDDREACPE